MLPDHQQQHLRMPGDMEGLWASTRVFANSQVPLATTINTGLLRQRWFSTVGGLRISPRD